MASQDHRVVITGIGVVSPFGRGLDALWQALLRGDTAVRQRDGEPPTARVEAYSPPANLDTEAASRLGRCSLLAADAAIQAIEDARLPVTAQSALLIGVTENVGVWQIPSEWQSAIAFGLLLVFIIFRPTGFFGQKLRKAEI